MDTYNKYALKAETENRVRREKSDYDLCKSEIYSSTNHMFISLDKIVDSLPSESKELLKSELENLYYHVGKIKAHT